MSNKDLCKTQIDIIDVFLYYVSEGFCEIDVNIRDFCNKNPQLGQSLPAVTPVP